MTSEQRGIRAGVRRLFRLAVRRRARLEREVDEELRIHLEMRVEQLVRRGTSPEAARAEALRRLGGYHEARRRLHHAAERRERRMRIREWVDEARQDFAYAARGIRARPGFAATVIATLALGIGANAIMFGVVDRLLLRPPAHVAEPERVTRIYFREDAPEWMGGGKMTDATTTYPAVVALREEVPSLEEVAGVFRTRSTVGRGAAAREIDLTWVDGNFFRLLGVRPAAGRFFTPEEDLPPVGARVAVLSHAFRRGHFAGEDPIGREIAIGATPFTVVGVAPEGFTGADLENTDIWIPVSALASEGFGENWHTASDSWWIRPIGRLREGATMERVAAEATVAHRREVRSWGNANRDTLPTVIAGPILAARGPEGVPAEAKVSLWLVGVAAAVLLVACANVANLLLARGVQRRREIAVRLALGVGRGRLVRQLLAESALLAALAAGVALLVAQWGGQLVRAALLPDVAWGQTAVDGRILALTLGATVLAVLLAGLAPAARAGATDVVGALKLGAGRGGSGRSRLRTGLLVAQAALSVVLLVGAGLFVRSLLKVHDVDVGIDLERVLLVRTDLRQAGYEPPRILETFRRAQERLAAVPGVEYTALVAASTPMRTANAIRVRVAGRDSLPDLPHGGPYFGAVTADYLATLGAEIVRGRGFTDADEATGARVMLVNRTVAKYWFPGEDPIGRCVMVGKDEACTEIVGVAEDILLFRMVGEERGQYYVPLTHPAAVAEAGPPRAMLVRAATGGEAVAAAVRREVQTLAPDMPYVHVQRYSDLVAPELRPWRLGATMFGIFGALALVIAAVGLYGVIAFAVAQRTHEIGVRMALGAAGGRIVRAVLLDALGLVGAGFALGALAALAAGRWIAPLLHDTSPREPAIYVAVAATFAAVAVVASAIPAWRASRVDPAVALRAD
ncbi:MAG TPA: ADOP family duplicated permease [Gemmatimonadaceae bacterium]